jgi:hypothetical protein
VFQIGYISYNIFCKNEKTERLTMPPTQTATNPKTKTTITFRESDHSYIDDSGARYASGTGLVSCFFPHFDTDAHAHRISVRQNVTPEAIKAEWKAKADDACAYGTLVHAYAEAIIKGMQTPIPNTQREITAFRAVDKAVVGINRLYNILGAEKIIFAECAHLAGTIDMPVKRKRDGMLGILDWKTNASIEMTPRFPGHGYSPIQHIPDCNANHYRLQFAVYAHIMRIGQYVALDQPFSNGIIHIPQLSDNPVWIPITDAMPEADAMIKCWERGYFNQELPANEYLEKCKRMA